LTAMGKVLFELGSAQSDFGVKRSQVGPFAGVAHMQAAVHGKRYDMKRPCKSHGIDLSSQAGHSPPTALRYRLPSIGTRFTQLWPRTTARHHVIAPDGSASWM
ncbi:hypothetical protein, partial [Streptomyces sp. ADI93-02]|uniref:hypothetical protein n=1 Tax=Streptomyces sp. ADI93-02 TaxID=1522757 RepID=UPI0019CFE78C